MEKHQITINIAAYGWDSEPWQGFYPADLPEDWRLDFYSNEFRAVVVPAAIWQQITPDMAEEWQDAVHAEFRFYFEINDQYCANPALPELFKKQWGGWVNQWGQTRLISQKLNPEVAGSIESDPIDSATPSIWYEGVAEPRQMREAIEHLHQNLEGNALGVIVVNAIDEPWEVASDMRQLVELMGYG